MPDHFPIRAYTPERDDNARDARGDAEDIAGHCRAILDALRDKPALFDCVTDPVALEEVVSGLEHDMHRQAQELNDDLGRAA